MNIKQLLTNIAIELLNHQIKGSLELNESFHILSSTGFPYLEKHGNYHLFNIELVKALIAITSLIMAIWPNMKGAADFSLLFKKNKNHTGKCIRRFAGIYTYCQYFIHRMW